MDALLGDAGAASSLLGGSTEVTASDVATVSSGLKTLDINLLFPSPYQPRQVFSEEAINDLVESIKEKGVLQPLLVRKSADKEGMYEIIAGERRWRASKQAGLAEVPVIEKEFTRITSYNVCYTKLLRHPLLIPENFLIGGSKSEGWQSLRKVLYLSIIQTTERISTVI